jgi:hypothetical protein
MPITGCVTAGRTHASIETSVGICGEYPDFGPTIVTLSAMGAAFATPRNIAPAVAAAVVVRKVLWFAMTDCS